MFCNKGNLFRECIKELRQTKVITQKSTGVQKVGKWKKLPSKFIRVRERMKVNPRQNVRLVTTAQHNIRWVKAFIFLNMQQNLNGVNNYLMEEKDSINYLCYDRQECVVSATSWCHCQRKLNYRIYSLIRRTIFYEKICLFYENLLKTRAASYNRVFSCNDCINIQTTRPS